MKKEYDMQPIIDTLQSAIDELEAITTRVPKMCDIINPDGCPIYRSQIDGCVSCQYYKVNQTLTQKR